MVFVNAQHRQGRQPLLDDRQRARPRLYEQSYTPANQVWQEGDPFPGHAQPGPAEHVTSAARPTGSSRTPSAATPTTAPARRCGRSTTTRRIACPNANWNGVTTNYCNGVTSDDVVAHEWGHAYTEYTPGLIYQWQPGALNEAYSDIWGETVDLINGRDDDEGDITPSAPTGTCSRATPARRQWSINAPAAIAGTCDAAPPSFGPAIDARRHHRRRGRRRRRRRCTAFDQTAARRPTRHAGKFATSTAAPAPSRPRPKNAQNAGATGIIIGNNVAGAPPGWPGRPRSRSRGS